MVYDDTLRTAIIVGEEFYKMVDTEVLPPETISENADVDIYYELQHIAVEVNNRIQEMKKAEDIEEKLFETMRKVAREVILDELVGEKQTFNLRYYEYYEGFYEVEARSLEEAKDILYEDIRTGRREGPNQCYEMDCEEV